MNELMSAAWHTAYLSRVKPDKLPSLKDLLSLEPKKPQTDEEMMAMCKMLNAAFGGKVVKK